MKKKRTKKLVPVRKRDEFENLREFKPGRRLRFTIVCTKLGAVLVAGTENGIAAILLGDAPSRCVADLETLFPDAEPADATEVEERAAALVAAHVDDPKRPLDFPLDLRGTPFQVKVWNAVRKIPPGRTRSYAEIAEKIGAPRAMRAVGSACAKCRHLFAVPCHRVTGSEEKARADATTGSRRSSFGKNGRIGPGADRRAALLQREIDLLAHRSRPTN